MKLRWTLLIALVGAIGMAAADPGAKRKGPPNANREGRGETAGKPRPNGDFRERRGPNGRRERSPRAHAENFMRSHDNDRDGAVTFDEFQAGEKMQRIPVEGRKRLFDHFDKNSDGKITRAELPKGPPPGGGSGPRRGDRNGDGKISWTEFAENPRLKDVPAARREELFKRMDHDGDGFLTPADWRNRPEGRWRRGGRGPFPDRRALELLDENGDKALSFEEWKKSPSLKEGDERRLKEMFERLDRNRDGKLDRHDRPAGPPRRGAGGEGPEGGLERRGPGNGPGGPPPRRARPGGGERGGTPKPDDSER